MEPNWNGLRGHDWAEMAIAVGLRVAGALAVLLVGMRIVGWIAGAAERGLTRAHVEPTAVLFLRKVAYVLLLVVLLLAVLQVVGVPMTSMIAVLGAAGLAIGLALKDSLSNIASGVMLVTLKPFRVGDTVTIAGETGRVEVVSIFQTQLRGADNQTIVLPNSLVTTDSIINLTPSATRRIELVVGIGYQNDISVARGAALSVMKADARVLPEPAPDVLVYALGDNSVDLGIRCHVANGDYFVTKCELTEHIKLAFDAAGISIPYPQREVHLYHHADSAAAGAPDAGVPPMAQARSADVAIEDSRHRPRADPE
ncbi:MAG TPA: mechanosensitive ion channel family protein [Luteimonas sp.]|nr:mechanosensitive ion channel family protein [Luteimonas sp.]